MSELKKQFISKLYETGKLDQAGIHDAVDAFVSVVGKPEPVFGCIGGNQIHAFYSKHNKGDTHTAHLVAIKTVKPECDHASCRWEIKSDGTGCQTTQIFNKFCPKCGEPLEVV